MSGPFRFKRFSVRNERAALKVGTDAVLLGAAMTLPAAGCAPLPAGFSNPGLSGPVPSDRPLRLLDIGTGTGVIALMAAQRLSDALAASDPPTAPAKDIPAGSDSAASARPVPVSSAAAAPFQCPAPSAALPGPAFCESPAPEEAAVPGAPLFLIDAIDVDPASVEEASANFADSPWSAALGAIRVPLQSFEPAAPYDAIFSNPPYFEDSLLNPDGREAAARHTVSLSYRDICAFAADHLVKPRPVVTDNGSAPGPPAAAMSSIPVPSAAPMNPYSAPVTSALLAQHQLSSSGGILSLIVPADSIAGLERTAASFGLRLFRRIDIRTTAKKPVKRVIAEFTNAPLGTMASASRPSASPGLRPGHPLTDGISRPAADSLILQDGPARTPEYSALTADFYL